MGKKNKKKQAAMSKFGIFLSLALLCSFLSSSTAKSFLIETKDTADAGSEPPIEEDHGGEDFQIYIGNQNNVGHWGNNNNFGTFANGQIGGIGVGISKIKTIRAYGTCLTGDLLATGRLVEFELIG